jgi:hypothetical protein
MFSSAFPAEHILTVQHQIVFEDAAAGLNSRLELWNICTVKCQAEPTAFSSSRRAGKRHLAIDFFRRKRVPWRGVWPLRAADESNIPSVFPTPRAFHSKARGWSRKRPTLGVVSAVAKSTLKGLQTARILRPQALLCNAFSVGLLMGVCTPWVRRFAATQGFGI